MVMKNDKELDDIFDVNCSKIIYCLNQNEDQFHRQLNQISQEKKNQKRDQDTIVPEVYNIKDA